MKQILLVWSLYALTGCTPLTFDSSGDPLDEEDALVSESETDGSSGEAGETPADAGEDVPPSDTSALDVQPDSGRESGDVAVEPTSETTVVSDAGSEVVKDTATSMEHRTATGESYTSSLPKAVYSPALFAETIARIEELHPGVWNGPYDATCNLSSEGHGVSETCKMIWKTGPELIGVMICPFGISYVAGSASCPPLASPVSWW